MAVLAESEGKTLLMKKKHDTNQFTFIRLSSARPVSLRSVPTYHKLSSFLLLGLPSEGLPAGFAAIIL
jgi:hypothetical protein